MLVRNMYLAAQRQHSYVLVHVHKPHLNSSTTWNCQGIGQVHSFILSTAFIAPDHGSSTVLGPPDTMNTAVLLQILAAMQGHSWSGCEQLYLLLLKGKGNVYGNSL